MLCEPNFEHFFDLNRTREVPADWSVFMTDIQGSSKAVQEGKHREVNLVGTASIAAVRNAFGPRDIPYVFGGDGATFLVPAEHRKYLGLVLQGVQQLAQERLGYHLRVSSVSVQSVYDLGGKIRFGFIPISKHEGLHFFRGNGITLVEPKLKAASHQQVSYPSDEGTRPDLQGLSCRLSPFKTRKQHVLSVLIEPRCSLEEEDVLYENILKSLCFEKKIEDFKPISIQNHVRPWLSPNWTKESILIKDSASSLKQIKNRLETFIENILGTFLFRTNLRTQILGVPSHYTQALLNQSDWIKMDGTLRMVIDATTEEEKRPRETLQTLHDSGQLFFGLATSEDCVMTCHLHSAQEDRHTHFIDGGQGGLTRASIQLKQQKAKKLK